MGGRFTGKIRLLSRLGTEIITFLYFYISIFCSLIDRPTDKIFIEQKLIYKGNLHKKMDLYLKQRQRKSRFPLNLTERQTDIHTYRRTDISFYREASLLKIFITVQHDVEYLIVLNAKKIISTYLRNSIFDISLREKSLLLCNKNKKQPCLNNKNDNID